MKCRICKSSKLTSVLSLGDQYLSEFRNDDSKPDKYPLDLAICKECNQVQLKNTAPQNLLYTDDYGYRSGINTTMVNHLRDLVLELIRVHNLKFGDTVIDIGSNDGTLLKWYPSGYHRVGFDLISKFSKEYLSTGIAYFAKPYKWDTWSLKAKVITAISMFYDIDDPVALMEQMAKGLRKDGIIVVQQNYLLEMLKNNAFDNVCHEHLCYHSVESMKKIAEQCGLEIFDVKVNDLNGGSFRTYICHKGVYPVSAKVNQQISYERDYGLDHLGAYEDFAKRVDLVAQELYDLLSYIARSEESCYVYGASTRGNTLLQYCGIDTRLVQKAVERNPEKYGKKIASVGIPIISEGEARKDKPNYMLVLPWFFKDEFLKREVEYLKNGGKLIFPLPGVEVVNA